MGHTRCLPLDVSGRTLVAVRRSSAACVVFACALVVMAACQRTHPPPFVLPDSGPPDAGPPLDLDSDGDGLCDVDEFQRRTDPNDADTDGDGFSDYVEAQNGSSSFDRTSPDRTTMLLMSEAPTGTLDTVLTFSVRGVGETMGGEFIREPMNIDDDGTLAQTFYLGSAALGASPMENVRGGIVGANFLGVIGRTLLTFSLHFAQAQEPRGCMRAYPFGYMLHTGDGSLRGLDIRWLVLVPPGMQIGAPGARWCGPTTATCI